jgi:hypothetical protein
MKAALKNIDIFPSLQITFFKALEIRGRNEKF